MTLRSIIDKYKGWCPHFQASPIRSTPLAELSVSSKVIFSILLGATGLLAIIMAPLTLAQFQPLDLVPYGNYVIITNILGLISGMIIIVLLIDFFLKKNILRRHRIEAAGVLVLWAAQQVISLLFNYWALTNQRYTLTQILSSTTLSVISLILFSYVAYRLFTSKTILVKETFLLLSIYFLIPVIDPYLMYLFNSEWLRAATIIMKFGVATTMITYTVAACFFIKTYLETRIRGRFTLQPPRYAMATLLLYGFSQTLLGLYYTFMDPIRNSPTVISMGVGYSLSNAVMLLQSAMLLLASFYPLTLNIGEGAPVNTITKLKT